MRSKYCHKLTFVVFGVVWTKVVALGRGFRETLKHLVLPQHLIIANRPFWLEA